MDLAMPFGIGAVLSEIQMIVAELMGLAMPFGTGALSMPQR
jgi:hypothetical protein